MAYSVPTLDAGGEANNLFFWCAINLQTAPYEQHLITEKMPENLTRMIYLIIWECQSPHDWQQVTIGPIFKKGGLEVASNNRHVELTPTLCKMLKNARNYLLLFFKETQSFRMTQQAFLPFRSFSTKPIDLVYPVELTSTWFKIFKQSLVMAFFCFFNETVIFEEPTCIPVPLFLPNQPCDGRRTPDWLVCLSFTKAFDRFLLGKLKCPEGWL